MFKKKYKSKFDFFMFSNYEMQYKNWNKKSRYWYLFHHIQWSPEEVLFPRLVDIIYEQNL